MKHDRHCSIQDCRADWSLGLVMGVLVLVECHATGFPVLFGILPWVSAENASAPCLAHPGGGNSDTKCNAGAIPRSQEMQH